MIKTTKENQIQRKWHLIDAKDQVLGRFCTGISTLLIGKSKPYYVRNLDCGDYVVVINSDFIKVTGRKMTQKTYGHYSGYPDGLKTKPLKEVMKNSPNVIIHAVSGMLPDNKLKALWLKKLYVFPKAEHKYSDKFTK